MTMLAAGDETSSGTASKSYEVGLVKSLPWPTALASNSVAIEASVERELLAKKSLDASDETSRMFRLPSTLEMRGDDTFGEAVQSVLVRHEKSVESIITDWEGRDSLILDALEASDSLREYLDQEVGRSPCGYESGPTFRDALDDLYAKPVQAIVAELITRYGGSRLVATKTYVADRLLEVLAHGTRSSVRDIVRWRQETGVLPDGYVETHAEAFFSYLVGLAFGRWDPDRAPLGGPDRLGFSLFPPSLRTGASRLEAA